MVNTWNSYLRTAEDGRLLMAAGYMLLNAVNFEASFFIRGEYSKLVP